HGKASGDHSQVAFTGAVAREARPTSASFPAASFVAAGLVAQNFVLASRVVRFVVRRVVHSSMTVVLLITLLLLAACGHPKQARVEVPPPPAPASVPAAREPSSSSLSAKTSQPRRNDSAEGADTLAADPDLAEPSIPMGATPIATETGKASW